MKYNINQSDRFLVEQLHSIEGQNCKENLESKIKEQEAMLDLFEQCINHCNRKIQLCINETTSEQDILKRQKYEDRKIVWEDNKRIWNISGFISLISIDIKTIQIGMYFAQTEWHKRFYARHACTIMHESTKEIFKLLGKDFQVLISQRIDITPFEEELKEIRSRLNHFQTKNSNFLSTVRHNTLAHKDKDVLKQLGIILDINWFDTIQIMKEFEEIINDLGVFMKRLIDIALDNIKAAYAM